MPTQAAIDRYNRWKANGRPFKLIAPADALKTVLKEHGYTVYDIGNDDHMLKTKPEDHTPYSMTGWPGDSPYGVGHAIDIMPPSEGQESKITGRPLPSLQVLGAQIVRDRKANVRGIAWLKYINWEPERDNGGPCYRESWQPGHARQNSTDRGHIHISGRTDSVAVSGTESYDPVVRAQGVPEGRESIVDEKVRTLSGADANFLGNYTYGGLGKWYDASIGARDNAGKGLERVTEVKTLLTSLGTEIDGQADQLNGMMGEIEQIKTGLTGVLDGLSRVLAALPGAGTVEPLDYAKLVRALLAEIAAGQGEVPLDTHKLDEEFTPHVTGS